MAGIRKVVLDVLIPLQISSIDLAKKLSKMKGVDGVDINIHEVERKVEIAKLTIIGDELDFDLLKKSIEDTGASIQSVDRVLAGKNVVEWVE
ncbi:DUF211 domain-containing protein [Candidatus Micrarchaeota archaeon]|nr:DUF211 domain-containing protein [Candidatus Micrarchaeota archaeon]